MVRGGGHDPPANFYGRGILPALTLLLGLSRCDPATLIAVLHNSTCQKKNYHTGFSGEPWPRNDY